MESKRVDASTFLWGLVVGMSLLVGCSRPKFAPPVETTRDVKPFFEDVTELAGIDFRHHAGGAHEYFFPSIMCGGGALLDFDVDGDLDILLIDSGEVPRTGHQRTSSREGMPPGDAARRTKCRLFRQDAGLKFVDVSAEAGLDLLGYGMGAAVGDVNNDGFPDIYVTCFGPDHLFVNRRDGTFHDQTHSAKIENERWGASAVFFDYDRDGWLDLFVTNYVDYDPARPCHTNNGEQDFCNPAQFPRTADKLFHNVTGKIADSKLTRNTSLVQFEDVSLASGIALKAGAGLGVVAADFTGDHWPDIYVANDGHANFLWVNQRDGTFQEEAILLGAAYDALGRGQGSMGIAVGDLNQDQRWDLLVTNLAGENHALYLSETGGGFREASATAGFAAASYPRTGFGTVLIDVEHDGDLDLLVANGGVRRAASVAQPQRTQQSFWSDYVEPKQLFLNNGLGKLLPIASNHDGFLQELAVSRALCAGDVDNDGDLDLLVTALDQPARLLLNRSEKRGHWVLLRLIDSALGGRDAYGAELTIVTPGKSFRALVSPGGSYLSSHDPRVHVGLGDTNSIDRIEIVWPDGQIEDFVGLSVDRVQTISRGQGTAKSIK